MLWWSLLAVWAGLAWAEPSCPAHLARVPLPADVRDPALQSRDLIVVWKAERRMARYQSGVLQTLADGRAACWRVALAAGSDRIVPHKRRQGDMATPEGLYLTSDKPWSSFKDAIAIYYPNARDADAALAAGVIDAATHKRVHAALTIGEKPPQTTRMGGEILIHGGGSRADWTLGCIALDDDDLTALRASLPRDQRAVIAIVP